MIDKCSVCGKKIKTILKIPFKYTDNIFNDTYVQNIGICINCGLIITQNPFNNTQLEDRYKNFSKFEFDDKDYILNDSKEYKERSKRQKFFIESNIDDKITSILEVGASSGYNLSLYDGIDALGIEPSEKNCYLAKKIYNIDMFNGMFSDFKINNDKKYDLIFLSHTLEHIVNPYEFILECKKMCNKYIFIEVPSLDYKYINEPFGFFCEEHVNYFTLESLINLMNKAGFEIINAEIMIGSFSNLPAAFPSVVTLFKKEDYIKKKDICLNHSIDLLNKYIEVNRVELEKIKSFISNIPNDERLAVWGTGHHVSMLLRNTDLDRKNIIKFYDSDSKKKGLTLIKKDIVPFYEDDITNGEIESILIGTYTAQEVIADILKKYENKVKIYKLY